MLHNTFKRQQLWAILPMDPSAWYFLLTTHQSELLSSQAAVIASTPLVMGPSKPAQGQGVSLLSLLATSLADIIDKYPSSIFARCIILQQSSLQLTKKVLYLALWQGEWP